MILGGTNSGKYKVSSDNEEGDQIIEKEDIEKWYRVIYVINPV